MGNNRRIFVFITLLAIPLIIFICLLMVGVDYGNRQDTTDGLEYISELEDQDTQYLEHSIANQTTAGNITEPPTGEITEPGTEGVESDEGTTTVTPGETEPSTEQGTQPPTEPPTQPSLPPQQIVVEGQSVKPYAIDTALLQASMSKLDSGSLSYKTLYADSLFVGDSITSGFDVYGIVNSSNVIAYVGANMNTHLTSNLDTIVQYNPKFLFVHYGLNEMNPSDAGVNSFITKYKENLQYLKSKLPYTKIIVLSLAPVSEGAIQKQNRFTWIGTYNDRMREMCKELGIGFHQNDAFFNERMNLYGKDGIHFSAELYRQWIRLITEEMGLY